MTLFTNHRIDIHAFKYARRNGHTEVLDSLIDESECECECEGEDDITQQSSE